MRLHPRSSFALLACLGALTVAGCGSDEPTAPATIADAKAKLSKDCQQGKASDKPLCDCIADKLEAAGNDAQEITALGEQVNGGKSPDAISKAAAGC